MNRDEQVAVAESEAKRLMQTALDDNLSLVQIWSRLEVCHRAILRGGTADYGYRPVDEAEIKRQVGEAREAIKTKSWEGTNRERSGGIATSDSDFNAD